MTALAHQHRIVRGVGQGRKVAAAVAAAPGVPVETGYFVQILDQGEVVGAARLEVPVKTPRRAGDTTP